jgi:hypothetical protein
MVRITGDLPPTPRGIANSSNAQLARRNHRRAPLVRDPAVAHCLEKSDAGMLIGNRRTENTMSDGISPHALSGGPLLDGTPQLIEAIARRAARREFARLFGGEP